MKMRIALAALLLCAPLLASARAGQLRYPHPVPETYFDAIMLKRP